MDCINEILSIQGNLKIALLQKGIKEHDANFISSDFIQNIIDAKHILSEKAINEINLFIKR